jgi:exopolysaccharide biosynthesis polyprenyl glycosylphosphotransferase
MHVIHSTLTSAPQVRVHGGLISSAPLRAWQRWYASWLRVSDAVVVCVSVFASQLLRFGYSEDGPAFTAVSAVIAVGWLISLSAFRTRARGVLGVGTDEYRRVWTATMTTFVCLALVASLFRLDLSRGYLAIALPLGLAALTMNRHLARRYVRAQHRKGKFVNDFLAVGTPKAVEHFSQALMKHPTHGYRLAGSYSPELLRGEILAANTDTPSAVQGRFAQTVHCSGASTVVVLSSDLSPVELRALSWQLESLDVDLVMSPGVVDVAEPRLTLRAGSGVPLLHVEKPQYDGAKRFGKRAFDVTFSLAVLSLLLPALLGAALAVKLTSRGPVFYRAHRVGLDGCPFRMIKFRSMVANADQMTTALSHLNQCDNVLFKIRDDPRVTRVGHFLRRYSIDELPQFFNVLRGEMSVVGPRPPLPREVEAYDADVRRRLLVRPGITGLWQVSGRSDLSWEDSVRLDLSYVENWSMAADLAIAAATVSAVLAGRGAY